MGRLTGKIAIVTGAGQGIGLGTATAFAREGADVILVDISNDNLDLVCALIGAKARGVAADVTDEAAWARIMDEIRSRHGRLDILVNNAAVMDVDTPETASLESARVMWEVNVGGIMLGCKHAIPLMREAGGSIVNVASLASRQGSPLASSYSASKGGVEAYTRSVAVYCRQSGLQIRCNSVHPSGVSTPMNQSVREKMAARGLKPIGGSITASGRELEAIDLANAIVFLASDESRYVTGHALVIDDGVSITAGSAPAGEAA